MNISIIGAECSKKSEALKDLLGLRRKSAISKSWSKLTRAHLTLYVVEMWHSCFERLLFPDAGVSQYSE